jgi:large subunit ribosomal protein L5
MSEKETKPAAAATAPKDGKDAAAKAKGEAAKQAKAKMAAGAVKAMDGAYAPEGKRTEPRLQTRFKTHVASELKKQFDLTNPMRHPKLDKLVININMGRQLENNKLPAHVKTTVIDTIMKVTGQKPVVIKARKSVSNFKVREGAETAAMVTLRRDRMWHFLDRFINLAAPRIKDFRGLPDKAFDQSGSYSFGLTEQGVFPEINMADVNFTHGMHITLTFRNSTPELSKFILGELGFPFVKPEEKKKK